MTTYVCATCGTQFPPSDAPPPRCPICEDERQYVPESGQRWTTPEELADGHRLEVRDEVGLVGIGMKPSFAIGQRALLVPHGGRRLMWDCVTLLDDIGAEAVEQAGGLSAVAISHPHYYSGMVDWAHRFDCPILLHEDDREWVMRPDPAVELWTGETREVGDGVTLIRCGGHFAGGTVLHLADGADGRGTLLSGDIVQVIPDVRHVGFMYSYPNLIPLPEEAVARIAAALEPYAFDVIVGAWWGRVVPRDGKGAVMRSAERYGRALRGEL
jgi:glyoxylase-like metal-dependent hydrolase (beta-lactamase superfamily II)